MQYKVHCYEMVYIIINLLRGVCESWKTLTRHVFWAYSKGCEKGKARSLFKLDECYFIGLSGTEDKSKFHEFYIKALHHMLDETNEGPRTFL